MGTLLDVTVLTVRLSLRGGHHTKTMAFSTGRLVLETVAGLITLAVNVFLLVVLVRFKSQKLKKTTRTFMLFQTLNHTLMGLLITIRPYVAMTFCTFYISGIRYCGCLIATGILLLSVDTFVPMIRPYTHQYLLTSRLSKLLVLMSTLFWGTLCLVGVPFQLPAPSELKKPPCEFKDVDFRQEILIVIYVVRVVMMVLSMLLQAWTIKVIKQGRPPQAVGAAGGGLSHSPNAVNPVPIHTVSISLQVPQLPPHTLTTMTSQGPSGHVTRQGRLVRLLVVSQVTTFVCWTPLLCLSIAAAVLQHLGLSTETTAPHQKWTALLVWLDTLLYPVIVLSLSSELRAAARSLLCKRGQ